MEKPQSDTPEFGTGNIGVVAPPLPREQTKEWIYVLECEHGCYYVGKTKQDPHERLEEHRSGRGAAWTRLHKPLPGRGFYRPPRPVRVGYEDKAGLDEDMETKSMMKEKGIDFVRGGSHMQPVFTAEDKRMLERELNHDADVCLHCGGKDHFVKDCPLKKCQASSSSLPPSSKKRKTAPSSSAAFQKAIGKTNKGNNSSNKKMKTTGSRVRAANVCVCSRCGRKGHQEDTCYAKTTVDGDRFSDSEGFEDGSDSEASEDGVCRRCGRGGHSELSCYAKTTADGDRFSDLDGSDTTEF